MDRHRGKLINVIATGFIVLVLFSLVLFWGRFLCYTNLISAMSLGPKGITIIPSRLVPGETGTSRKLPDRPDMRVLPPREPNYFYTQEPGPIEANAWPSQFSAEIEPAFVFVKAIGAFWDIQALARMPYDINERTYFWFKDKNNYLGWDYRSGLLVRRYESKVEGPAGELVTKSAELFAGPNGVSETADSSLGRFHNQLIVFDKYSEADRFVIYDAKYRRFYVGDFMKSNVIKGLQLEESDSREPVRIGTISVRGYNTGGTWSSPRVRNAANKLWVGKELFLPGDSQSEKGRICTTEDRTCTYITVLDKTGRIFIYNSKEQTLIPAGYLPKPESLFAVGVYNEIARPKDVLAYKVLPVYATLRLSADSNDLPEEVDVKYLGMNVTCISREGTVLTAAVFDPNGALVYCCDTKYGDQSTARAIYSDSHDAPMVTTILFLLENLQPVVFEAAAYLCGDHIEASAGHRAIFFLPNTFVGMLGRVPGTKNIFLREVMFILLMGPSLILSVWLAVRVRKDAKLIGLSSTAGKWWIIGVIIFGLPAYITYRMNRHREVLVTCQNCGMMRRPDMEKCHRCGSKWDMPELTPPSWRICD